MKKILLSLFALTVLTGTFSSADAQYHHHHHRNCFYRHGHRVCR